MKFTRQHGTKEGKKKIEEGRNKKREKCSLKFVNHLPTVNIKM